MTGHFANNIYRGITFFASDDMLPKIEELNGTHPLKTAPPPKVLGKSRTLANANAPAREAMQTLLIFFFILRGFLAR